MTQAYVFIAVGNKYIEEAITLVKSIRLFDFKKRDTVLVTEGAYENKEFFSHVIDIKEQLDNFRNKNPRATTHDLYCVAARVITPQVVEQQEFIMLDTDMLCMWNPEYMWNTFSKENKCFACVSGCDGSAWHWGHIDEINKKNNMEMLPMHGGVIYFNKTRENMDKFFDCLNESLEKYDDFGFKRLFRKVSMTDEPLFSYAMYKTDIKPLKYYETSIVSFCLPLEETLPIRAVTWGHKRYNQLYPCIINHFTGLHEAKHIQELYKRWINKLFTHYISSPNETTLITMLFNINRETEGDGRKFDDYCSWLEQTCKLDAPMVIYCEPGIMGKVAGYRKRHPKTIIRPMKLEDVPYYEYLDRCKEIQKTPKYKFKIKDKYRLEIKLALYNLVLMAKIEFVGDVAVENPFDTDYFFWIDAGTSRFFHDTDTKTKVDFSKPFPKLDNMDKTKINIQTSNETITGRLQHLSEEDISFEAKHFVTGTFYGGTAKNMIEYRKEMKEAFLRMLELGSVNIDQIVMALVHKKYPSWFKCYLKNKNYYLPILTLLSHRTSA